MFKNSFKAIVLMVFVAALIIPINSSFAQDKLKRMPGYDQYQKVAPQIRSSVKYGSLSATWSEDGNSFTFVKDGKTFEYDIKRKKTTEVDNAKPQSRRRFGNRPARGRQYASAESPNKKLKAFTKDRNMFISNADGSNVMPITTEGNDDNQMKFGIATWVYGEELGQNTAMWWSPDSKKVAFYKFDEKNAKKYYVIYNQTKIQDSVEIEAYPKVGAKNLPVDLMVYDLETKKTITLDLRDGKPYDDGAIGTYIYNIGWSPDGTELLYHSTNRKQDIMEYRAANPNTGKSRTVVREEWLASFTKNSPEMRFLEDGKRFIWASERSGFNNYYLYNIDGTLINPITTHEYEASRIVNVDEDKGYLYYYGRSGDNHMKMQLHRVKLNGSQNTRLTDPAYNHSVSISPDGKHFVDVSQRMTSLLLLIW